MQLRAPHKRLKCRWLIQKVDELGMGKNGRQGKEGTGENVMKPHICNLNPPNDLGITYEEH